MPLPLHFLCCATSACALESPDPLQREQAGAGLDALTAAEMAHFTQLNDSYRAKFEFPFILAVKGTAPLAAAAAAFCCRVAAPVDAVQQKRDARSQAQPRRISWTRTPSGALPALDKLTGT